MKGILKKGNKAWIPLLYVAALALLLVYGAAPRTLTATDGETYAVTVTYDASARIPSGSTLKATELSGERYQDYYARAVSETGGFARMRAFDLRCVAPDGSEIEPRAPVKVSFRLAGSREAAERARVLHFIDEGGVVAPPAPAKGAASDGYYTLDFETDSFSVYATLEGVLKRTLTASDDKAYQVTVEYDDAAGIPDDAELVVNEIREGGADYAEYVAKAAERLGQTPESVSFARAFDITLRNPLTGGEYQPDKDVQVSIELLNDDLTRYDSVEVVHISGEDGGFAELMDCELRGEAVAFAADGFSVYVLIGSESEVVTPRCTYIFYAPNADIDGKYTEYSFTDENGNPVSRQTIKNGDRLIVPRMVSEDETKVFDGWYEGKIVGEEIQLEETPYDFDNISITEDSEIHLYAVYKEYAYVIFHGQYDSEAGEFPIIRTRRAELAETESGKSASVRIDDISAAYNSVDGVKRAFWGWSYAPSDEDKLAEPDSAGCITVTKNVDLYPVYKEIHWLIYYAAQSGLSAAYVPPAFYFQGDAVTPPLPTTSRTGYTFQGWYTGTLETSKALNDKGEETTVETVRYGKQVTDADGYFVTTGAGGGAYDIIGGRLYLHADVTLYAKWEADYRIVYWKQNTTESPETADKTYDYAETVTKAAGIGDPVSVAEEDRADDRYSGYKFGHCDSEKTIQNTKKLTVLNVYYDLDSAYAPSEETHTLTFADSVTGTGASPDLPSSVTLAYGAELSDYVPETLTSGRASYTFTPSDSDSPAGWYLDADCTVRADLNSMTMPDHDLTLYAGWEPVKYRVQIDPNYGALYAYDSDGKLQGSGATYFNNTYDAEPIGEYTHVTRDYAKSSSGTWFYVKHDLAYGGADRFTYYTQNPAEATEDTAFEYAPGAYTYAGWYEVYMDESGAEIGEAETPYDFSQRTDHPTKLRLHWKKNGVYFLSYDAQGGAMEDGEKTALLPDNYADRAEIALTRSAVPPTGYAFVGWRLRGDDNGRVYAPGETFTLYADDAVRASGKEIVTLEAVYARASVARIVYDANGGAVDGETVDFGSVADGEAESVSEAVDAAANTVTVSGLGDNSKFTLSDGTGFSKDGFELAGWSHKAVYAPGDELYELGKTYGVDALEPTTLYAVWKTTVTYHLNQSDANWGNVEWDSETYTKDSDTAYSQTVYLNNALSEPPYIPRYTGENGLMYRYWATTGDGDAGYDFTKPVTEKLNLYAYWSAPQTVTVYAVDASAETPIEKTSVDGWTVNPISVGTSEIALPGTDYVTAPDGYAFAFAAAATGIESISDYHAVSEIRYDSVKKSVCVKYKGASEFVALESGYDLYFVYYQEKSLDIRYQSMGPKGVLQDVGGLPEGAVTETGVLGEYDVAVQLAPSALGGYSHYAFAIGDANAATANGLRMMTNAVAFGASAPILNVRNGWRGFEYSTDDAEWVNCGYAPTLYVVYYDQIPTVVMFHEKTVGSSETMKTEFTYNYVVTQTTSVWNKSGGEWTLDHSGEPVTVYDTSASGTSYKLKNGEANSAILFYSETNDSDTQKTVTAQSVTITQTPDEGFTTDIDGAVQESEPFQYVYTADGSGGAKSVTFTNTHKAMTVEVHVAVVENDGQNGGIIRRDSRRADTHSFLVELGKAGGEKPLEKLSSADTLLTDTEDTRKYAFGAVMYGSAVAEGQAVSVAGMDVASVAYERVGESDVYELVLKDGGGNSLGQLGQNALYFLYYPMPQIRYVKENADGTLTDISGASGASITYGNAALTMNGQTVAQKQSFEIPLTGFVISQTGNNFRMPAILDDGAFEHYLSYVKIGAGNADAERIDNLDGVSESRSMRLEVRENTLRYSFDGVTWTPLPLSGTPTIYAIYDARGYDLQISKTTVKSDESAFFANASFTVTLTSKAITKGSYEIEGADDSAVTATPASGEASGSIVLTVRDGTKVKIKGLGRGDYVVTESGNENYALTAKTGSILGGSTENMEVKDNGEISLTLNAETKVDLTNTPKELCRIGDIVFYTLQDAMAYVAGQASHTATIEMLTDYAMPVDDTVKIPEGFDITLTTAASNAGEEDSDSEEDDADATGDDTDATESGSDSNNTEGGSDSENAEGGSDSENAESGSDSDNTEGGSDSENAEGGSDSAGQSAVSLAVIKRGDALTDAPLFENHGTLTFRNIILDGASVEASAPMIQSAGSLTVNTGTTVQNALSSGDGGAIRATAGNVTINSALVAGNRAARGGALYYDGSETITLSGTAQVRNNAATDGDGGAIYADGGSIRVTSNASLSGNRADNGNGGAIYAGNAVIDIEGAVRNNAARNGGAVYALMGKITVAKASGAKKAPDVTGNAATDGDGGALWLGDGSLTVSGGAVSENRAEHENGRGGAVYVQKATVALSATGAAMSGNASGGDGGAIYAETGAVTLSGRLENNTTASGNGGAVYANAGAVTVSGGKVSGNAATLGDGGAIYANAGAVTVSGITLSDNRAGNNGGALYVGSGSAALNPTTAMKQNRAKNGAAVFVDTGKAAFDGGAYTENVSSDGGAVGVGNDSARLTFSSGVRITDNTLDKGDDNPKTSNVYLNQDSEYVLNIAGLGGNAAIGVYVSDEWTEKRDVPGARFASYTDETNAATAITNDRYDFQILSDTATKKLFWGKAVAIEIRYLQSYNTFPQDFPPKKGSSKPKFTDNNYYPEFGSAAISELAAEFYNKYNKDKLKFSSGEAYGGAYVNGDANYQDYLTHLIWDSVNEIWTVRRRDGATEALNNRKIIIYYALPAYISIENNTEMTLTVNPMTVNDLSVINSDSEAGYGMVFATNGAIRTAFLPVTEEDLQLKPGRSINLMIPGGRNKNYVFSGQFDTTAVETVKDVSFKRTGSNGQLTAETLLAENVKNGFKLNGKTLNNGTSYEIVFGDSKNICKVTDDAGEHPFARINAAVQYIKDKYTADDTEKSGVIEILTDYLLPETVKIPAGFDITLTTAAKEGVDYPYIGTGDRATISRDAGNNSAMIETENGDENSALTIKNLIFDGKSVQGSSNGGGVSAKNFGLTVDNVEFKNVYAGNGGAIFAQTDVGKANSKVTVSNSNFYNCHSTLSGGRNGGGAIHAFVDDFDMWNCDFDSCTADWQAGAVFHRVDTYHPSSGHVADCTFTNCQSKAAGGLELDSVTINVENCDFDNCFATSRNGGAFNIYVFNAATPPATQPCWVTVTGCTFNDCRLTGTDGGNGGAFRSNAIYTTVQDCTFINTSSVNYGGAISISNGNAKEFNLYGCTIQGCASNNGGGIYSKAAKLVVGDYELTKDGVTSKIPTTITNCVSRVGGGGGVLHDNSAADSTLVIRNSVISGNTSSASGKPGGGVYSKAQTAELNGATISDNRADGNGGGLCYEGGNNNQGLTALGCTMDGNTSNGSGGGIYTLAKIVTLGENADGKGSVISNCIAALNGGGLYQNRDADGATLTLQNSAVSGCRANGSGDNGLGGGVYTNARTVTVEGGSEISGNRAANSGGGLLALSDGDDRKVIIDASKLKNNVSGNQGGGLYTSTSLTLRNGAEITGNRLSTAVAANAAGVYLKDGRTLYVGAENAETDTVIVSGNSAAGAASDLRLWEENGQNKNTSVYVYCHLTADSAIYVVNANKVGTQFGSSQIEKPNGFSDNDSVFKADSGPLHGIIDRMDATYTKIIWAGEPVAKITDGAGNLLYMKDNATDPAIFDRLDSGKNSAYNTMTAFNMLRMETPPLYNKNGTLYEGKQYYVKMLVENYTTDGDITLPYYKDRTVTFTTAGHSDADYPYKGSGTRATVTRGAAVDSSRSLINVMGTLTLENIVIDGGSTRADFTPNNSTRCMWVEYDNCSVTLGPNAVLQNGDTTSNGGGVNVNSGSLVIRGGVIRNCSAKNGGGVYKQNGQNLTFEAGNIYKCTATGKGGGVYLGGGKFDMSGGTVSDGTADEGGGVYVANGKSFNMSGGSIVRNDAATKGGGIAIENAPDGQAAQARLYFSKRVTVSGNTKEGGAVRCNVELDEDSNEVINTRDGGLNAKSYIGVYVPGEENNDSLYDKHGVEKMPFGHFFDGDSTTTLYCFVNDRNGLKGGRIANPDPNTIYWVQIFALQVVKEVEAWHGADPDDVNREFAFEVTLSGTPTSDGQLMPQNISSDKDYYGAMIFQSNGINETKANFKLTSGDSITGVNLSHGLSYKVRENLSSDLAKKYAAMPTLSQSGTIGDPSPDDPYTCVVTFKNVLPACKITDDSGKLLYRRYAVNGKSYNVPAVYTELYGENGAFKALETATFYTGESISALAYAVSGSQGAQIQMLVPAYTMLEAAPAVPAGVKVTLTTAKTSDAQFPYQGAANGKAVVKRAYDGGSMFTVNGNLTLTDITLDGAKGSYASDANGGLVNVAENGGLTIQDNATLKNSKTNADGGAVYVNDKATVTMSGGAIQNNESDNNGAGIYLKNGATLKLSGNPYFGGAGVNGFGDIVDGDGNYKTGTLNNSTNGSKDYSKARQDIYLEEAGSQTESIVLTGSLTGAAGSVWVWALAPGHYNATKPFAKTTTAVSGDTYKIFRNARTDDSTGVPIGESYLTGTTGENPSLVYWTGYLTVTSLDFSFRKTDGFGNILPGAEFTLYDDEDCLQDSGFAPVYSDASGAVSFESVPTGTYYMKETVAPSGYASANKYVVLIGDDALNEIGSGVLADITPANIAAQTGNGADEVAIFLLNGGKAVAVPDIRSYGILNVSADKRTVVLRKVGENGGDYVLLKDAEFDILRYDMTAVVSGKLSSENGLFWAGELEYGTYYLHEKTVPGGYKKLPGGDQWFELTVDSVGVAVTPMTAAPTPPAP